jgi:hypothetical protein
MRIYLVLAQSVVGLLVLIGLIKFSFDRIQRDFLGSPLVQMSFGCPTGSTGERLASRPSLQVGHFT